MIGITKVTGMQDLPTIPLIDELRTEYSVYCPNYPASFGLHPNNLNYTHKINPSLQGPPEARLN